MLSHTGSRAGTLVPALVSDADRRVSRLMKASSNEI